MCPVFPVAFPCLVLSELLLIQLCCVGSCTVLESSGVMESLMAIPGARLIARYVVAVWLFHPALSSSSCRSREST